MKLTDKFWKTYELDLQEVKLSYLNWAIGYDREPKQKYRHLFLWDHQKEFSIVNSRYGRSYAISPFGSGVNQMTKTFSGRSKKQWPEWARLTGSSGRMLI